MARLKAVQQRALEACACDIRTDDLSRCLFAVDASIYRVQPAAVAFPKGAAEVARLLFAAADNNLEITPRGAGSGLTGGALGRGLVVDLARHNTEISDLDLERGTVRVGPGVVLDSLNRFLAPHGLWFGPDVATSSRATLGGMIGNNSSGAHAPVYGTTADHVEALEVALPDGKVALVGLGRGGLTEILEETDQIIADHAAHISECLPPEIVKRWPGYGLDRALKSPGDLTRLIAGSEGTLAAVTSAVVRVVPRPLRRSLGVLFFASVEDALRSAVELVDLEPAAVEHLDRLVFDQTRGQRAFAAARALLRLDEEPCEAILLVEFFDDDGGRLEELERRGIGQRRLMCANEEEQELVWAMRRAGLSLVTSCKGPSKPTAGIEDVCVRPDRLPDYVAGLREILAPLGLEASFYGHAASGELHVRPVLDLHTERDLSRLRQVADEVSELSRRFSGSLTGEHGVGIARTEYMEAHLGPELLEAMRRIKGLFDPRGLMNPGKIIGDGRYSIDGDLRLGHGSELQLPFSEVFSWFDRDGSFVGNLEQCNGCGGCRKDAPTMCPTYGATGEELLSTRGRANIIRAALEGRFSGSSPLAAPELEEALNPCLACKACKTECPSNVDMALLKAELLHARHRERGAPLRDRVIAAADLLGRIGTLLPSVANFLLQWGWLRRLIQLSIGIDAGAPLPPFAQQRFDVWFRRRQHATNGQRGPVILWDDTWTRYHEPEIGRAAVSVLEAVGFSVVLAEDRVCCGRPAASRGLLDQVRRFGAHNLDLLAATVGPIVFLEPSCWSIFVDEYRQLKLPGADEVASRCVLFEDLLLELIDDDPGVLPLSRPLGKVAVHGHCHAKALSEDHKIIKLLELLPGTEPRWLETGCCGMAGAFGMMAENRDLGRKVSEPLMGLVESLPPESLLVASGTSCRHQIMHLGAARPRHLAEVLAAGLGLLDQD
jgi:FAD/FMN-containing dehydrogenase/Fe-S oxidoreductase